MKKLFARIIAISLCAMVIVMGLSGCGKFDNNSGTAFDAEYDMVTEENANLGSDEINADSTRKVIEYITLDIETKSFDKLIEGIEKQIAQLGGYVESSDVSGNGLEYDSERYATYKIRIPTEKTNEFTGYVSEKSAITRKQINTKDVTLEYVDIESRLKALAEEKKSLEQLLAGANALNDVITVRDRLTEVIAEIESYTSKLRTLSNLVEYTTVTLNISEVEHIDTRKELTVWQKIGRNLKNGFMNVWVFLKGAFVFVVSSVPYVLLFAAISGIVFGIVKLCIYRKRKKSDQNDK